MDTSEKMARHHGSVIINIVPMKQDKEVYAAISLALHEFMGNNVHDNESGKITIKEHFTEWNGHALTMTGNPSL